MPEREQRKLTTILAADVVGYSRLTGADEEGTLRRLRALRAELIDPAIATHRGRVFHTAGDSILIEFTSVVDAARCALAVQHAMARHNEDFVPEKRIAFRVGIRLGDVMVEDDGDLMGDGVNIAARLEGIAEAGGICLSEDAWRQVRDRVDVSFADLGERELKNIARPVRVYALALLSSPSPPPGGGEGRGEVGDSARRATTSPSRAVGAGPALSATRRGEDAAPRLSIVVLPFANIGGDPEQEYFVDGVTEDLTTELSRLSGAFVIARNTAFTYKSKPVDVKEIGRDLGVRYVLEGSVRRGGNRLRVNVQLIDTESGAHLWAERFDRDYGDLFEMQDEIVSRLANQLNAELIAAEARRAEHASHPDAMDLYFRGKAAMNRGQNPDNLRAARDFYERALALDPKHADGLAALAYTHAVAIINRYYDGHFREDRAALARLAEAAATDALAIAPNHPFAHFALGTLYVWTGRGVAGIAELEHAIALDRNFADAHTLIGNAKTLAGRAEETQAHIDEAFRISPRDPSVYVWHVVSGNAKLSLGHDQEAVLALQKAVETNRNNPLQYFFLAAALALTGRMEEAGAAAKRGLALDPTFTIRRMRMSLPSNNPIFLVYTEHIIDGMRRAGVPGG